MLKIMKFLAVFCALLTLISIEFSPKLFDLPKKING